MITIRNMTKRPIVLNLAHAHACSPTECTCGKLKVGVQDHNRETGDRIVRAVHQRVPASVTIFPKGAKDLLPGELSEDGKRSPQKAVALDVSEPLLDTVAKLPEVIALVRSGSIKIEKVEPAADPKTASAPDPTETKTASAPVAESAPAVDAPKIVATKTTTAKTSKE